MFFVPRICEHCLNPSCMASLPLRRDLQALRGRHRAGGPGQVPRLAPVHHRLPVQEDLLQPPHRQGREVHTSATRASRWGCRRCAPRPAWDGCATSASSSTTPTRSPRPRLADDKDLYQAQLDLMLDPNDPQVIADAKANGIPGDWLDAAAKSPVYALIKHFKVALPLHPEYRTMPMVWYVPAAVPGGGPAARSRATTPRPAGTCSARSTPCASRVEYLAELFTAGDAEVVTRRAAEAGRDALLHARRDARPRAAAPSWPHAVGMEPAGHGADVPAAGDRQVRRALRHPEGPRASRRTTSRRWAARSTSRTVRAPAERGRSATSSGRAGAGGDRDASRPRRPARASTRAEA